MTRTEQIITIFKTIVDREPTFDEVDTYSSLSSSLTMETMSAVISSQYTTIQDKLSSDDLVKSTFQKLFNYTEQEMNVIIQEQSDIELSGGVNGFKYWIDEIEGNDAINETTLAIALLNGADNKSILRAQDSIKIYYEEYELKKGMNVYSYLESSQIDSVNITNDVIEITNTNTAISSGILDIDDYNEYVNGYEEDDDYNEYVNGYKEDDYNEYNFYVSNKSFISELIVNDAQLSSIDTQLLNIQNDLINNNSLDMIAIRNLDRQIEQLEDFYEYTNGVEIDDYFEAKYGFELEDIYEYNIYS